MPAVVDLAAMRDAIAELGGDPARINPLIPAELVIDHSVQVDVFASRARLRAQRRARVRAQPRALRVPALGPARRSATSRSCRPGTGICHQVNLEYLARVVEDRDGVAFPDTLVGTDSHTTMVNGLGVLGWGVGGIEAEAAMLGEPLSMLVPQVVGFRLARPAARGRDRDRPRAHRDRAAAQDRRRRQVRRVLRRRARRADRRRPRDAREHVARVRRDLRLLPGRRADARLPAADGPAAPSASRSSRRTARRTCSGTSRAHHPTYSQVVELDLGDVEPSLAGPRRPQDRVPLARAKESFLEALDTFGVEPDENGAGAETFPASDPTTEQAPGGPPRARARRGRGRRPGRAPRSVRVSLDGEEFELDHGAVVIAAITSCTNTSNPQVMIAAGLLAKKAVELGLRRAPVGEVVARARLARRHRLLRARRPADLPRRARLQHRRLRLHDLHRQLGPAARRRSRRRSPTATSSPARCSPATATSRRASIPR